MEIVTADNNPFFERQVAPPVRGARIANLLQLVVILGFIVIVLYQFVVTPNQVHGRSMLPNFVSGDVVLTNRLAKWLNSTPVGNALGISLDRGDVLVIETPELVSEDYIIKRLIGMPGDTVMVKGGRIYVNQKLVDERDYLPPERQTAPGSNLKEGVTVQVPEGRYAIMGDNRPESLDSRDLAIAFVKHERVIGKVIFRFWPFDRVNVIGRGNVLLAS